MAGYIRQDIQNTMVDGLVIYADILNDELNAVQSAFSSISGHTHDGSVGEGGPITVIGPGQDIVVTASLARPKTTAVLSLGSTAYKFKDALFSGNVLAATANITTISATTVNADNIAISTSGNLDFADILASTPVDLTKHINLHGDGYGFNVTGSQLNAIFPSGATFRFYRNVGGVATEAGRVGSGGFYGVGANLTELNASALTSGTVPDARLSGDYTNIVNLTGSGIITFNRIKVAAGGTSAAPKYSFVDADNAGLHYNVGSSSVMLINGGVARLSITTSAVTASSGVVFNGNGSGLTDLNASEITSGTISTARLATTTQARDWVMERTSEAGVNTIGSYAYLALITGAAISVGSTYAASDLRYSGVEDESGSIVVSSSGTPSGTWQAQGHATSSANKSSTLFKRVA